MTNPRYAEFTLNSTQSITASCPPGSAFSTCSRGSKVPFFGCCNSKVDPCEQGCVGNSLQPAAYDPEHSNFTDQSCNGSGLFYTCSDSKPTFVGCCTTDPCQSPNLCPFSSLQAVIRTTFNASSITSGFPTTGSVPSSKPSSDVSTANTLAQSTGQHDLAPRVIAGIAGGAGGALLALGIGLFFCLRRRWKHAKTTYELKSTGQPESPDSVAVRFGPLRSGKSTV
jgi:hypothetical protein